MSYFRHYECFNSTDKKIKVLKEKLKNLDDRIIMIPIYKGSKSYTLDKKSIYLCLYDNKGNYYPDNFLIYVLIHELAHYFNDKDWGHTPAFYRIFHKLKQKAIQLNIYDPSQPMIQDYCMGKEESFMIL